MIRFTWVTICVAAGLTPAACSKDDTDVANPGADVDGDGVSAPADCDDGDASVLPGADERCDGRDEDCDGRVDEDAIDRSVYFVDDDGDGYGVAGASVLDCAPAAPAGAAARDGDCDDARADVHPDAVEVCDGVDQDCDLELDEGAIDAREVWVDGDGDGYGAGSPETGCPSRAYATRDGDCDDAAAAVNPAAAEVCENRIDDDCDALTTCRLAGAVGPPASAADEAWSTSAVSTLSLNPWGAWLGDVDGDGYDDVAVSGPFDDAPGVTVLWGGDPMGSSALPASSYWTGGDAGTGYIVVDGGDTNGDGYADVLLANSDALRWLPGGATRPGAEDLGEVATVLWGDQIQDVAYLGDMDGDGFGDFAVGDGGAGGSYAGAVWLVFGDEVADGALSEVASSGMIGDDGDIVGTWGATDGGDLDGDGLGDVVTCAADGLAKPTLGAWSAILRYGDTSRSSGSWTRADADARFTESSWPGMYTWCDVAVVTDVDGDGRDELAFATAEGFPSHVWLWTPQEGRFSGDYDTSSAIADLQGSRVIESRVTSGDLDADGYADLAVAQPWPLGSTSEVDVFYGEPSFGGVYDLTLDADARIVTSDYQGAALALDLGGDGDGDGYADLLAVRPGMSGAKTQAWLFYGAGL